MPKSCHGAARVAFAVFMVFSIVSFARTVGVDSVWFGVVASFSLLGLMDLAMPFVRLRVPSSLRNIRPWEKRGGAYRVLGVSLFGAFLRGTPLRLLNRRVYLREHPTDFASVHIHLENAEAAHFWSGIATMGYLAFAWMRGGWSSVAALALFNLVVNLYPILHLRLVRGRLERALQKDRPNVP